MLTTYPGVRGINIPHERKSKRKQRKLGDHSTIKITFLQGKLLHDCTKEHEITC